VTDAAVPVDGSARAATLSTGQSVRLPLRCVASAGGVVLATGADALARVVPASLEPLRVAPGVGLVTVAGVAYDRVDDGFAPYDELAVVVAVTRAPRGVPVPSRRAGVGGYVHALPVSTAASRALGREVWGYPKRVAAVDVRVDRADAGGTDRVSVRLSEADAPAADPAIAVAVDASATRRVVRSGVLDSYAVGRGLVRAPVALSARVAVAAGRGDARLALGTGPTADALRELGVGEAGDGDGRIVARFVAPVLRAAIGPPVGREAR
jgi:hypothetical protein